MGPGRPRRSVVALAVVLAGCGGLPADPLDDRRTNPGAATVTPEPTPRPHPDHPEDLDADSATSLAADCERALVWNQRVAARDGVVDLEFEAFAENVSSTGDGWVVDLSVDATVEYVEPMHELVGHRYRLTYVVGGEATRRTNVTGRPPDLLPEGRIESC